MPKINLLPKSISELIAAGEVVERPASAVKEMIENSIDAGAKHITVEIKNGGITFIRITDDGCGISADDVPLAFLRHATSKIRRADDLDSIATLGFRGEALAATCAVAKIELFTKTAQEPLGTHYKIEGGIELLKEESGCPEGTTIIIRDLFYNTPARMKFLKKDVSEANSVAAIVDRAALSHPEIAFKLIRDGKQTLSSPGDGKLSSAIYSVLGKDFSTSLISVNSDTAGIGVEGFVCKPVFCRQSRSGQYIFLNGRFVRSGTVTAACEQAYKNSSMVGKFPAFVLNISLPFDTVDVNIHPAKTEVRFSDEKRVFESVHYAVKNALSSGDTRPAIDPFSLSARRSAEHMTTPQYHQQAVNIPSPAEKAYKHQIEQGRKLREDNTPFFMRKDVKEYIGSSSRLNNITPEPTEPSRYSTVNPQAPADAFNKSFSKQEKNTQPIPRNIKTVSVDIQKEIPQDEEILYIGEAFSTYIVVQKANSLFLVDKHAAHERLIYNELKQSTEIQTQLLISPVTVRLSRDEYDSLIANIELLAKAGFEAEDFGNSSVAVRAVPSVLAKSDIASVITEAAAAIKKYGSVELEALDNLYHTVACKAAIKGGQHTTPTELTALAKRVLSDREVMYCPHGRPVAFEIKRRDLEKQFGRIQ